MLRWIKNGGWIAILTMCIFLAYCTFYLVHSTKASQKDAINPVGMKFLTITAYADDSPPVEDNPDNGSIPSEPPGDSSDNITDEYSEYDPEYSEEEPANPDAAVSGQESQNDGEDETMIEDENAMAITEYGDDILPEDEITLLIQVRDILNIILCLIVLCISGFFVWILILRPIWDFVRY